MDTRDPYRIAARFYDRIVEPMQAGVRQVALELVPAQPTWEVLDVGCGTGTGLRPYAEAGCTVVGADVSPAMLDRARVRLGPGVELHHTDVDELPFESDRFDLVTTSMVLHEVPADERISFLEEMARVAKPDGQILIIDFRFGELRGWKGPLVRALSEIIERFSGHFSGYRSFKTMGGVPVVLGEARLDIAREKVVAGGNIAIFAVSP